MTLWGEPERVHMLNMEQLHAHDRHQNVTEHSTTLGHWISHKKHTSVPDRNLWVRPGCVHCTLV